MDNFAQGSHSELKLVNSEIFKLSLNLSFAHLRAQIACYEFQGDLSLIFHGSFENLEITRICMEIMQE